jgi:methylamine---glutamate N-methyltransferase subunit A
MNNGLSLGQALERSLSDLDGFYTFVVGTKDGFGVLRDPTACKPAVLAETNRYVALGSLQAKARRSRPTAWGPGAVSIR